LQIIFGRKDAATRKTDVLDPSTFLGTWHPSSSDAHHPLSVIRRSSRETVKTERIEICTRYARDTHKAVTADPLSRERERRTKITSRSNGIGQQRQRIILTCREISSKDNATTRRERLRTAAVRGWLSEPGRGWRRKTAGREARGARYYVAVRGVDDRCEPKHCHMPRARAELSPCAVPAA